MEKTKILNLYAGIGGNRKLWVDCSVTSIECNEKIATIYKNNFPGDYIIITDAKKYLQDNFSNFDFIWASPPCQKNSKMALFNSSKIKHFPDLSIYELYIFLKQFFKGKFVIENVKPFYVPLIKPSCIIGRHYFWSNFEISILNFPNLANFINLSTIRESEILKKWLGIQYDSPVYYMKNHNPCQVLKNCVHPLIGEHIFKESKRNGLFSDDLFYN
jgi:DNA (cytosine-5)-methyltransferase 1